MRRIIHRSPNSIRARSLLDARKQVGLTVFCATLAGYIPSHTIRHALYCNVFGVNVPKDSVIYWRCRFFKPSGVNIGHHSIIGNDTFLDGREGIYIGNNVNIAGYTLIFTQEHDTDSPTFATVGGPVSIEDWVYTGARVTILPNIKIGEGAVVAAGAVVTRDVEPWTVVGGVPARFIRRRPVVHYDLGSFSPLLFD
jgi:acetyltransferase-like isoleucine patch superfamily enzyme